MPDRPPTEIALRPDHTMLFIAGLHRSGTSPLFKALRLHPLISGFEGTGVPEDEGQHLQTVYPIARTYGGPGLFGFDPRAHLTEASPLASEENRRRLLEAWRPLWDLQRPVLMEKSPPNLLMMRFLQRLFPGARFIALLRHPIAVSFATQKWSGTTLDSLLAHWTACHEIFMNDAPLVRRLEVLSYEGLLDSPGKAWERISSLVSLPSSGFDLRLEGGFNERYFEMWSALDAGERGALIERHEPDVARFGYSLRDPARDEVERMLGRPQGGA